MRSLSALGLGTFLLLVWRFVPLPLPANMLGLPAAYGVLAAGVGLAGGYSSHARALRVALAGVVVATAGFVVISVEPTHAETLPVTFGLAFALCATVSRFPRWSLLLVILLVAAIDYLRLHDIRPLPAVIAALFVLMLRDQPRVSLGLGAALLAVDALLPIEEGFIFMVRDGADQFTVVSALRITGLALVASWITSALPDWRPIQSLGRHALTLNVAAAALAISFGTGSATFNWTRYSPIIAQETPFNPFAPYSLLLSGWQSWWMALFTAVIVILLGFLTGWGPLEVAARKLVGA